MKYRLRYEAGRWGLFISPWHKRPFRTYKTLPGAFQAACSLSKGWWRPTCP